ncbi:MAG: hypothetical protein FJY10_06825 [Bacteroidetes bacterium]|nr:hypothetical protein [Bacteroidota bacterium]
MKTKMLTYGLILAASFGLILSGCKKEKNDDPDPNASTSVQQVSQDDQRVGSINDDLAGDAELILSQTLLKSSNYLPCNATIDSVVVVGDTVIHYVSYDGPNCNNTLNRVGKMEIRHKQNEYWYSPNASVRVTIIDLVVTRISDQKTFVVNGNHLHTNVSGGLIVQLGYNLTSVTHRSAGYMQVTFEDNSNTTWNVARQLVYTGFFPDSVNFSVTGFGVSGTYQNLVTWGTARNGDQFFIHIPQAVLHKQQCFFAPVSGIKKIDIPTDNKGATLTFGYDSNNQPVTGNDCPTKYRVDWYKNGYSGTVYLWL